MLTFWLCLVISVTSLPVQSAMVEYGQAKAGVFFWIGGTTLSTPVRFIGDPTRAQVYAVDALGQQYPLFINEPVKPLVFSAADSVTVEYAAPGLLNPAAAKRREQILRRLVTINDSLTTFGQSPDDVAVALKRELQGQPEIGSVRVNGNTVWYYWRGWSVASSFTTGRRLPVLPATTQFQNYAQDILTHLQNGEMVVMGYNGMYTIVAGNKTGPFRAEIERLRLGRQSEAQLLTNKLVSDPIKLRRSTVEWLKQASREE